jgi:NADH-quinone oxidoreductase subunit N
MLFGIALLYGLGGSLYLADLLRELPGKMHDPVVLVSLILSLSGFLFKLAAFPFHFWASDVYEGAPHQVAAYIATASKVAAIAVLLRLVALSGNASGYLSYFLMALALISMTVGNLAALVQQDFKRLLAFSTIAHAGYVLIGILSVNPLGYASAVFYALSLLVMKYSCFMVVTLASKNGRNPSVADLAGLHRRAPVLALALMLALFGLAGIPPTIGFTAKLLVFMAAMKNGYLALVLIAMINVVISLYYYLQVLKAAYFLEPASDAPEPAPISAPMQALAGLMIGLMIVGGLYPKQMIALAGGIVLGLN